MQVEAIDIKLTPSLMTANLSHDPFWHLPQNISTAKPGDILRWQDIDAIAASTNWTIPAQYASEDIDGEIVAASAFLLIPYAPQNGAKKLRTLVWTHGTAGVVPICAPTNHKNLYYDWAGLGSTTPKGFQYVAGWTHAADVAFSVIAAKRRIGALLSDGWVTVGQSEGGMTAWRVNERLALSGQDALRKAGNFLGSVAIAPANRVDDGVVPIKFTAEDYKKTCKEEPGSSIRLLTYAGQNHDSVTNSAQADYMSWVNDLFNGKKMKKGCSRVDIPPLTDLFQPVAIQYIANM
ncbi:hypothetical protein FOC4_g10014837 [Fusarium odoratissimum]|uniref:Peptidase S9 prolyl oligopeptidase catalytic domain-containing protein n=1 Tax=Fusarium oxysporum f. sp. cubense (strain race 4) TaxID=2502994 RepID=N1R7A1_FUSC4|nr:hypothetical protein FOC4_g10014837 [Fusarium odoratissimum]